MIKNKFSIRGRLILWRLASSKIHVAWLLFDYCWNRDCKKVRKHLNRLETFFVRTFVRLVTFVVGFSD